MARKPASRKGGSRPMTRIAVLVGVLAVIYGSMFATGSTSPKLGLDLEGGTTVTLKPTSTNGQKVTTDAINKSVDIIRQRVEGFGVANATVVRQGNFIVVSIPGKSQQDVLAQIGRTARLTFREDFICEPAAAVVAPTPSPSVSGSANPSASPGASVKPSSSPKATISTPSASPSASAAKDVLSRALLAATPAPAATPTAGATTPATSTPSSTSLTDGCTGATVTPDANPPDAIVTAFEANTPCAKLNATAASAKDTDWVIACDTTGAGKYLLEPAKVVGSDVKGASATVQQSGNVITGVWEVDVQFTGGGQKKFTALTQATINKQVAIVLDGVVQSAPTIQTAIPGDAQITGSFTSKTAGNLANILKFGALPITFVPSDVESVSASLGHSSLQAGLIAGALGIGLVLIYCFIYYRAMGIVTVVSLATSAVLVFGSVCILGKLVGFTLDLSGIAGLIVSIGITADSFVVFYERLKDEVREGRTPRSSVQRGWVRARRTILSADSVSFLAALVLYVVSVGTVKGFAFTLGLSTLLDLVVVFLFTKPLVEMLVQIPLFSTSRWSGLTAVAQSGAAQRRGFATPETASIGAATDNVRLPSASHDTDTEA